MDMTTYLLMRDRWGGGGTSGDEDAIIDRSITEIENSTVTSIGEGALVSCYALTKASFPAVVSIGYYAFASCYALTTVNFPVATNIGSSAFYYCYTLAMISFPAAINIRQYAFAYCNKLSTVNFPVATNIEMLAFCSCFSLATISFPAATSIGYSAFWRCNHLLSLYLLGSSRCALTNVNAFTSTPISDYTYYTGGVYGSIFVPASLYSSYISATNWVTYSARFVSMTDEEIAALNI